LAKRFTKIIELVAAVLSIARSKEMADVRAVLWSMQETYYLRNLPLREQIKFAFEKRLDPIWYKDRK